MKALQDMNTDNITELIKKGKYVLFFTATWCGDCKFIKPAMPEIEAEYPEYQFIEVDRDEFMDLCQAWNIFGIPSFVVFHDGKEVDRFVNKDRKTKNEIETFMNALN